MARGNFIADAMVLAILALLLLLAACSTGYGPRGVTGGYVDQRLGNDRYLIEVVGNAYTSHGELIQHLYTRADEIATEQGYDSYTLEDISQETRQRPLGPRPFVVGIVVFSRGDVVHQQPSSESDGDGKQKATGSRSGTGFFVTPVGEIITNLHVVEGCQKINVKHGQQEGTAALVHQDADVDIALLKTALRSQTSAHFRPGHGIRPGDDVVAIGFPLRGLLASDPIVTTGSVSALAGIGNDRRFIQMTAPVQPGSSGGPLLDLHGSVVGVVVSKLDPLIVLAAIGHIPENVNFAVNAGVVKTFLDAYNIQYEISASLKSLTAAEVAQQAQEFTALIECTNK